MEDVKLNSSGAGLHLPRIGDSSPYFETVSSPRRSIRDMVIKMPKVQITSKNPLSELSLWRLQ